MASFIAGTKRTIWTEVVDFDGERSRWRRVVGRPDVHAEVGHVRRIDLRRLERDACKEQVRVELDSITCYLDLRHISLVPIGRPRFDRNVGVGIAEQRDHVGGRDCRRRCGVGWAWRRLHDVNRHAAFSRRRADGGRNLGCTNARGANDTLCIDGCHRWVRRGEGVIGRSGVYNPILSSYIERYKRATNLMRSTLEQLNRTVFDARTWLGNGT